MPEVRAAVILPAAELETTRSGPGLSTPPPAPCRASHESRPGTTTKSCRNSSWWPVLLQPYQGSSFPVPDLLAQPGLLRVRVMMVHKVLPLRVSRALHPPRTPHPLLHKSRDTTPVTPVKGPRHPCSPLPPTTQPCRLIGDTLPNPSWRQSATFPQTPLPSCPAA